jgi:hypothetical protein
VKTVVVSPESTELQELLEQARVEDLIVRTADGAEFMLSAVDEFDHEIARTRRNAKLMAFLEERARQTETIPLEEVKRRLGI